MNFGPKSKQKQHLSKMDVDGGEGPQGKEGKYYYILAGKYLLNSVIL